jgi:BolA family transcriptional regulator, general stress-responsive regulator
MTARMHVTAALVQEKLQAALAPTSLRVQDDSAAHAGHAGAAEGSHFSVALTSAQFVGASRVKRHQLVYQALGPLMQNGIHALAITAHAPGETPETPA